MFPDFDSICFDNSVEIYGLKGRENLDYQSSLRGAEDAPLIYTYKNCPDSIILFFRELTSQFHSTFIQSEDKSLIQIYFNFQDCLDLFMQKYKQTGIDEFDHLAQKVIEIAILDKEISHLILVV